MDDTTLSTAKTYIMVNEGGLKQFPYVDTVNKITIGIGYNLTDRGLPIDFLSQTFNSDVAFFSQKLDSTFTWFAQLDGNRQTALLDMAFNLGWNNFLNFKNMLVALGLGDYDTASHEVLNSTYAKQVPNRALKNYYIIKNGVMS